MLINNTNLIIMFIILFSVLAFGIGQVVWIYLDSRKRGDKFGILWAIFALTPLFIPMILPLPLVVYLLVTRAFSAKCNNCNTRISSSFLACPNCGVNLKEKCNSCGRPLKEGWNYCPYCNDKIKRGNIKDEHTKEI